MLRLIYYLRCMKTQTPIEKRVKKSGYRQTFLAEQLGVSPISLNHAIKGTRMTQAYKDIITNLKKFLNKKK